MSLHYHSGMVWLYFSPISGGGGGDFSFIRFYLPLRVLDRTGGGCEDLCVCVRTSLVWLGFKTTLLLFSNRKKGNNIKILMEDVTISFLGSFLSVVGIGMEFALNSQH